nr:hypothetical protein CFP56_64558 [Quercus suber]
MAERLRCMRPLKEGADCIWHSVGMAVDIALIVVIITIIITVRNNDEDSRDGKVSSAGVRRISISRLFDEAPLTASSLDWS